MLHKFFAHHFAAADYIHPRNGAAGKEIENYLVGLCRIGHGQSVLSPENRNRTVGFGTTDTQKPNIAANLTVELLQLWQLFAAIAALSVEKHKHHGLVCTNGCIPSQTAVANQRKVGHGVAHLNAIFVIGHGSLRRADSPKQEATEKPQALKQKILHTIHAFEKQI